MNIEKTFAMFCSFISQAKQGKKCIMFGPGYVVLDKNSYNTLVAKKETKVTAAWFEETAEINEETWVEKFYKEAHEEKA